MMALKETIPDHDGDFLAFCVLHTDSTKALIY